MPGTPGLERYEPGEALYQKVQGLVCSLAAYWNIHLERMSLDAPVTVELCRFYTWEPLFLCSVCDRSSQMEPRKSSLIETFKSLPRAGQILVGLVLVAVLIFVGSAAISGISAGLSQSLASASPTSAASPLACCVGNGSTPTVLPTDTPAPKPVLHYPPKTLADLRGLAAKGDASAIHPFHSDSVGLTAVCPQPERDVTVDVKLTGQELAQDLLSYFYVQNLDNPCGSVVFADHAQSDMGNGYTAGRVKLDVKDASGSLNNDPNGTNLMYTLTLDVGDFATGQEYTVSWTK